MLQGAIIGAVVALIVILLSVRKRKGAQKKLLAVLHAEGLAVVRPILDKSYPPVEKLRVSQIIEHGERMAGLALIGDLHALEAELAMHTGSLTTVAHVDALGLIGLAIRSPDPTSAAARLDELATKVEQEGGITMGQVKKKTRALAALAQGVAGMPISPDHRGRLATVAGDGALTALLIWQGLAQALYRMGDAAGGEEFRQKVLAHTNAFEPQQG